MDEKKWMEKIKKSGEGIDAPEQLEPKNIKKTLEGEPENKKKRWSRYAQWGAVAAAFVLLITGAVSGLTRFTGSRENNGEEIIESGTFAVADAQTESGSRTGKTQTETEKQTGSEADGQEELYAFAGAATYQEVFDALAEADQDRYLRDSGGMEEAAAEGVMDVAENGMAMSSQKTSNSAASSEAEGSYSKTNLQELGVDEADIIKTDGKYLYVLKTTGKVQLVKAEREKLEIVGSIVLSFLNETPQEMYVDGDTLNVIATGSRTTLEDSDKDVYEAETENYTKLYTYDITDRTNPKETGCIKQEGNYSTSRKNGDIIYLFTQYYPELQDSARIDSYIPAVDGARLESTDIYLPEYKNSAAYLVISSINNQEPSKILDRKAVVSAAENFYVSEKNIYIANTNWSSNVTMTQILKFHYENGKITAAAAGDLKGSLNDTFSLNEYNGYLRAVLTDYSGDTQRNALYVLDDSMEIVGSIEDIAEGEDIRSARFFGDTGYFVTFRNMDPLFSVDLSDPRNPKILGELKITGFSSYLHFYGENMLLGVGNEVDPETGAYLGIKLSMFDISEPSDVKEIHKYVLKDMYDCPLFYNYKAAMIDVEKNLFGFMCDTNYMIFTYDKENGFENVFTENLSNAYYSSYYYGTNGMRGCYIGDMFYLIGGGEIRVYDMTDGYKGTGRMEI